MIAYDLCLLFDTSFTLPFHHPEGRCKGALPPNHLKHHQLPTWATNHCIQHQAQCLTPNPSKKIQPTPSVSGLRASPRNPRWYRSLRSYSEGRKDWPHIAYSQDQSRTPISLESNCRPPTPKTHRNHVAAMDYETAKALNVPCCVCTHQTITSAWQCHNQTKTVPSNGSKRVFYLQHHEP